MTLGIILALSLLALLGMPIFAVLLAAALIGFYQLDIDLAVVGIEIFRISDMPLLIAIPLFTFAGFILSESKASTRFVSVSQALLGWLPSHLAIICLLTCAIFTAFTGASGVTIVALGALLLPALKQVGYRESFSLGLVTTSGSLGLLLPPSVPLILYGVIAQQLAETPTFELTDLFIAAITPALFMIVSLSIYATYTTRNDNIIKTPFCNKKLVKSILEAKWELPLPFFVLAGIYGGYFAVSEIAAITAAYVLITEVFIYREISIKKLPTIISESMMMTGGILLILAVSLAFTNVLIDAEVPSTLFDWVQANIKHPLLFLALLNVFLLVLGAFLDIFSAIVIVVPLILPIALGFGIDPIHLGIIFLANLQIGYLTPPIGMNLFIASFRFEKPILDICKDTIPFIIVLLAVLLVITYWPSLSLYTLAP